MVHKFFDKKSKGSGVVNEPNWQMNFINQLLENLKTEKFILDLEIICGELIQLINEFNEGFRYLLFFIDIFSKYAWVVP